MMEKKLILNSKSFGISGTRVVNFRLDKLGRGSNLAGGHWAWSTDRIPRFQVDWARPDSLPEDLQL